MPIRFAEYLGSSFRILRADAARLPSSRFKQNLMFGSAYSRYPEILSASLTDMSEDYRHYHRIPMRSLQSLYIRIFGVPEIGFQLRFIYFKRALRRLRTGSFTTILDAGSGIGSHALWLASKFPKTEVRACDVDEEKLAFSRALPRSMVFRTLNSSVRMSPEWPSPIQHLI